MVYSAYEEMPRKRYRQQEPDSYQRRPPPPSPSIILAQGVLDKDLELKARAKQIEKESIKAIIALATEDAAAKEAAAAAAAEEAKAQAAAAAEKAARRKERGQKKSSSSEDKEANKEKRLLKLVGAIVVKCMSKHSKSFDKDAFKSYAKEVQKYKLCL